MAVMRRAPPETETLFVLFVYDWDSPLPQPSWPVPRSYVHPVKSDCPTLNSSDHVEFHCLPAGAGTVCAFAYAGMMNVRATASARTVEKRTVAAPFIDGWNYQDRSCPHAPACALVILRYSEGSRSAGQHPELYFERSTYKFRAVISAFFPSFSLRVSA